MTTTIVYASAGDGYLTSTNASYATAAAGSGVVVNSGGDQGWFGQNNNGGQYQLHELFTRFVFSAVPASQVVTSAAIQLAAVDALSPSVARDLEARAYTWSGSGLTAADWRTPADLSSATLYATVSAVNGIDTGKLTRAGNEALRVAVSGGTSVEVVVTSNRQRTSTAPTSDEGIRWFLAAANGVVSDPALIFTTAPRSRLFGVVGASAQLPDGSWAYLENPGGGVVDLKHCTAAGVVSTIAQATIGTASGQFGSPVGAQAFALIADPDGNLYLIGENGSSPNTIRVKVYVKGAGNTWTAGTDALAGLPSHSARINQVAGAFVPTSGTPCLFLVAARATGTMVPAGATDTSWVTLSRAALIAGTAATLTSGDFGTFGDQSPVFTDYGTFRNETGTGLDVAASTDNPGWVYGSSFTRGSKPGQNAPLSLGRAQLSPAGNSVSYMSRTDSVGYGTKDASAKIRVLEATGGTGVHVSADGDHLYGITVAIRQHTASTPGSLAVGLVEFADEDMPTMPDGPAVAASLTWDVMFSAQENQVWVYYVDATNPLRVLRTPVNLTSSTATRETVTVYTAPAGSTIQVVRVPRGTRSGRALVQVAYSNAGSDFVANVVDGFNLAPTAPILTIRSGFDAGFPATLEWTPTDPNPGDAQTAYQLVIEDSANPGVSVVDTGKVTSTVPSRTLAANTLTNGKSYLWKVRTWDALDVVGPYSDWGAFPTAAGGSVTITDPATDNVAGIDSDEYTVRWSVTGTVQAAYRYRRIRTSDGAVITDTGFVTSTATSRTVTGMLSDTEYLIEITVRNAASVVSNPGTRLITPSYSTPLPPEVSAVPSTVEGCILVQITNPEPAPTSDRPDVVKNEVYRRRVGEQAWTYLADSPPNGEYRDFSATSGVAYEYMVRGIAS